MRTETSIVDWHGGYVCVKYEYALFSEPKMYALWWPCYRAPRADVEYYIGRTAEPAGSGSYNVRIGEGLAGRWITFRLAEGGATKAIKTEERYLPCPKVRKGITTRYSNGKWQKLLRQGWVTL